MDLETGKGKEKHCHSVCSGQERGLYRPFPFSSHTHMAQIYVRGYRYVIEKTMQDSN